MNCFLEQFPEFFKQCFCTVSVSCRPRCWPFDATNSMQKQTNCCTSYLFASVPKSNKLQWDHKIFLFFLRCGGKGWRKISLHELRAGPRCSNELPTSVNKLTAINADKVLIALSVRICALFNNKKEFRWSQLRHYIKFYFSSKFNTSPRLWLLIWGTRNCLEAKSKKIEFIHINCRIWSSYKSFHSWMSLRASKVSLPLIF